MQKPTAQALDGIANFVNMDPMVDIMFDSVADFVHLSVHICKASAFSECVIYTTHCELQ
jgi:hypothetical protein